MVKCSVSQCSQRQGCTLFTMPRDPNVRENWLKFLIASGKAIKENVEYRICEDHFLSSDLKPSQKRKSLNLGAVPSILIPEVSFLIKRSSINLKFYLF